MGSTVQEGSAGGDRAHDFKLDAEHGPPPQHRVAPEQVARELAAGGLEASVLPVSLPHQYIVVGARPAGP